MNWIEWAVSQEWCSRVVIWPKTSVGCRVDVMLFGDDGKRFQAPTLGQVIEAARVELGGPE